MAQGRLSILKTMKPLLVLPEDAIKGSPLNRLPPEIRAIIYSFLLVQPYEILISFKRFRPRIETQGLFPDICMHCGHKLTACKCNEFQLNQEFFYDHLPLQPSTISIGILSTCRLIYNEAVALLYKQNTFHFADPTALTRFTTCTSPTHIPLVENLILTIHSPRREVRYRWEPYLAPQNPKPLLLNTHFPALKTAIVRLRGQYEIQSGDNLIQLCGSVAQMLQPCTELKWVHVNGLVDEGAIWEFAAAVRREKKGEEDGKEIRIDVSSCWSRLNWTNATIWWGNPEEKTPYTPPFQLFDLRVKRLLQRPPHHGAKYTVREIKLPYVNGVGGDQGAWNFM